MENASKALIMAAEVLVGVMIISIAVFLFNSFGRYSEETNKKIEDTQIAEFNNKFLKYYGSRTNDEGKEETVKCTIHDIAGLANLASRNNVEYDLQNEEGYSGNSLYIQIDVNITTGNNKGNKTKIEKWDNDKLVELIKKNDLKWSADKKETNIKYFKCTNCNINLDTKRVNYMKFEEI